ncbi:IS66 family transposase [Microbispora sp. NBC_01389]|uniref:IS66 family transposase n=1 Tax=Microbispora sp. NBC_01389 TaxID=2903584 RepID=UPI00324941DC
MSREELIALARALAERTVILEKENAELREHVAVLEQENAALRERVARLERLISRNSGNSGMPPSADDLPGKKQPKASSAARGAGKRRPGKQPGAAGVSLAWSDEVAERDMVEHFPEGACGCGADLAGAADLGVTGRHQQIEIPLVTARRLQHNLHTVACRCGAVHTAARPDGVSSAPVSLGVNLQAWCVYLLVVHAIPVHRCVELVASLTGAQPSVGFVHGLIARAAGLVASANARIRALLTLAYMVCCDETPIRVGPKKAKKYLLVACTKVFTSYMLGDRDMATFKKFVVAELTGVVVHDRYQNYDSAELGEHDHQLCVAHLLRDLQDCAETYPGAAWPAQIQTALRGLIHAANLAREQGRDAIAEGTRRMWISSFRHGVRVGLSEVRRLPGPAKTVTQPVGRVLLEVLRDREDDVLRFARDLRIPPTNNQAERDVRPAKTQQKISGRLRSERTTAHRYAIRGYLSTAAKHGADVMTAIRDALVGRAWMPPDPTPA